MSSFLFQNNSQIVQILVHRPLKELHTVVEIILNRLLKSFKVRLTSHLNILVFLGLFFLLRFNFSYIEKHCSNQVLFCLSRKFSSLYKRLLKENKQIRRGPALCTKFHFQYCLLFWIRTVLITNNAKCPSPIKSSCKLLNVFQTTECVWLSLCCSQFCLKWKRK